MAIINRIILMGILLWGVYACVGIHGGDQAVEPNAVLGAEEDMMPYILSVSSEYIYLDNGERIHLPELADDSAQVLFVLRHAEEDSIGLDPGLSDVGYARASRLAVLMRQARLEHLYGILFRRTVLTIRPLVKAYDLEIEHYDPDQVNYLTRYRIPDHPGNSLVVGTSHTVAILLNLLTDSEVYQPLPKHVYDRLYIVVPARGESEEVRVYPFRY